MFYHYTHIMNERIDGLIESVNRIVEHEVRAYVDERIEILLSEVAMKYKIPYEDLYKDYQKSCDIKKRKCSMTTTLGHSCKYDARTDNELCKKHFNKAHTVKQI